jgi:diketogulonate reductase-like aldo/keto reductase
MTLIASELETSISRVALAWLRERPGVASIIIGARTMEQLEDILGSLEVELHPEQRRQLDDLTRPQLNFPAPFLENAGMFYQGGTTINGRSAPLWPLSPTGDTDRH